MSVTATNVRSGPFSPNGVTTSFPFTFQAASDTEILPYRQDEYGVTAEIVSGFFVVMNDDGTGSVVFDVAPEAGDPLWVSSNPSFEQSLEFENQGMFLASSHEEGFDRSVQRDLYMLDLLSRAVIAEPGVTVPSLPEVVDAALLVAGKANTSLDNVAGSAVGEKAIDTPDAFGARSIEKRLSNVIYVRDIIDGLSQADAADALETALQISASETEHRYVDFSGAVAIVNRTLSITGFPNVRGRGQWILVGVNGPALLATCNTSVSGRSFGEVIATNQSTPAATFNDASCFILITGDTSGFQHNILYGIQSYGFYSQLKIEKDTAPTIYGEENPYSYNTYVDCDAFGGVNASMHNVLMKKGSGTGNRFLNVGGSLGSGGRQIRIEGAVAGTVAGDIKYSSDGAADQPYACGGISFGPNLIYLDNIRIGPDSQFDAGVNIPVENDASNPSLNNVQYDANSGGNVSFSAMGAVRGSTIRQRGASRQSGGKPTTTNTTGVQTVDIAQINIGPNAAVFVEVEVGGLVGGRDNCTAYTKFAMTYLPAVATRADKITESQFPAATTGQWAISATVLSPGVVKISVTFNPSATGTSGELQWRSSGGLHAAATL